MNFDKNKENTFYNLVGNLVPLISAAVFIPYLTHQLAAERFGFLTLMWALIGYFGIFDLGISKALIYHSALATSKKNKNQLAPTIIAGIQLVSIVGLVGLILLVIGSDQLANYLIKNSIDISREASTALIIVGITIPATTIGNALRGSLEGLSNFRQSALIKSITGSAFFVAPGLLVFFNFGNLISFAYAFLGIRLVTAVWCWLVVSHHPLYTSSRSVKPTNSERRELVSYGVWTLASSIISPLMVYGDRFIISGLVGVGVLGIYAILQETLGRTLLVSASFASAIQPSFTHYTEKNQYDKYKIYQIKLAAIMMIFYLAIYAVSQPIVEWWLGKSLDDYRSLFIIFSIALFFNSLAQLTNAFLLAKGKPNIPAKFHLIEFLVYMPMCVIATQRFGLNGAAITWMFRVILDYGLQQWAVIRIIR